MLPRLFAEPCQPSAGHGTSKVRNHTGDSLLAHNRRAQPLWSTQRRSQALHRSDMLCSMIRTTNWQFITHCVVSRHCTGVGSAFFPLRTNAPQQAYDTYTRPPSKADQGAKTVPNGEACTQQQQPKVTCCQGGCPSGHPLLPCLLTTHTTTCRKRCSP